VDKHGVEFANTRTRGKPNCGEYLARWDFRFGWDERQGRIREQDANT